MTKKVDVTYKCHSRGVAIYLPFLAAFASKVSR